MGKEIKYTDCVGDAMYMKEMKDFLVITNKSRKEMDEGEWYNAAR